MFQTLAELQEEKGALNAKIVKLTAFIESVDFHADTVSHADRYRYQEQQKAMCEYQAVLHDRILIAQPKQAVE